MTSSTPYNDTPMQQLGAGPWRQALGDKMFLLEQLSQGTTRTGLLPSLQGLLRGGPQHRVRSVPVLVVEVIGMDVSASVTYIEGSDGTQDLLAVWTPRRVKHTNDGHNTWADEDGFWVTLLSNTLLLPDPNTQSVTPDTAAWQTWWVCQIPEDLGEVVSIQSASGPLLAGLDFYRTRDRILFREHPVTLFPTASMNMTVIQDEVSPLAYAAGCEGPRTTVEEVCRIKRLGPTPARLQKLADVFTGTVRTDRPMTIQRIIPLPEGFRYLLADGGELVVPYDHTPAAINTMLPVGYQFGRGLTLYSRGALGPDWWRAADLSAGISLDPWCPVKGLRMPAGTVRVDSYDDAGTVRVRVQVEGEEAAVTRFQYWCQTAERRLPASRHLAPALGIVSAGVTQFVEGMDLLFNKLWGSDAILITGGSTVPKALRALLQDLVPLQSVLVWVDAV